MEITKNQKFKIGDVSPIDIMSLRFILDIPYLKGKEYYTNNLSHICKWIIKTIVTEHNSSKDNHWYMTSMKNKWEYYDEGVIPKDETNYLMNKVSFLNYKVRFSLSPGYYGDNCPPNLVSGRKDMRELLTRDKDGKSTYNKATQMLNNEEFDKYCMYFIKTYFPKFYDVCIKTK